MTKEQTIALLEKEKADITAEIDKKIKALKNKSNWVKIKLSTGKMIEVEKELHTDMKYIRDIKIPTGQRLLELWEFIELLNNHREIFWGDNNGDEWINQPVELAKAKYPFMNVWFDDPQGGSGLYCGSRDLGCGSRAFGVRFVKEGK